MESAANQMFQGSFHRGRILLRLQACRERAGAGPDQEGGKGPEEPEMQVDSGQGIRCGTMVGHDGALETSAVPEDTGSKVVVCGLRMWPAGILQEEAELQVLKVILGDVQGPSSPGVRPGLAESKTPQLGSVSWDVLLTTQPESV